MIQLLQFIAILFGLAMCYLTYVYYKKKNYSTGSFVLWTAVWIGFIILASFPTFIYGVMQTLKIERTVDFFVISAFLFFSVMIFYMYNTIKKNEKKLEDLVRKIALTKKK